MTEPYQFKIATTAEEFAQIHALNYRAFVEEIPQHPPNPERRLVDKFHDENSYIICLLGEQLIGMLALRDQRPFSLDSKLTDLDSYLPPYRSLCEVRLLAVEPAHRRAGIFGGLLRTAFAYARSQGHDLAVMSGTVRELALYERLGWVPFGPRVGTAAAPYQPMFWTLEQIQLAVPHLQKNVPAADDRPLHNVVNLLPGPVTLHATVQAALAAAPISHRLKEFVTDVGITQKQLCRLTGAAHVALLMGSGTLANDAVAAQLALLGEPGLMLANGEFGGRLADHARRAGLDFTSLTFDWGQPFDYERVAEALADRPVGWLWANHCETSTGVLNDLPRLKTLCQQTGTRLVVDAISSIGLAPVDLDGVYLAAGVSGKGLGAVPGIAMVYYNHNIKPQPEKIPSYLDLGLYADRAGVPFTLSSNLLYALKAALDLVELPARYEQIAAISDWCRQRLSERGIGVLAPAGHQAPAVLSMVLPAHLDSYQLGRTLLDRGYQISFASRYLVARNVIQLCFFSPVRCEQLWPMIHILEGAL